MKIRKPWSNAFKVQKELGGALSTSKYISGIQKINVMFLDKKQQKNFHCQYPCLLRNIKRKLCRQKDYDTKRNFPLHKDKEERS